MKSPKGLGRNKDAEEVLVIERDAVMESELKDYEKRIESLILEKVALKEEVSQWKKRVNQLVENGFKMYPEELKKLQTNEELEMTKQQLTQAKIIQDNLQNNVVTLKKQVEDLERTKINMNTAVLAAGNNHRNVVESLRKDAEETVAGNLKAKKELESVIETERAALEAKLSEKDKQVEAQQNIIFKHYRDIGRRFQEQLEAADKQVAQLQMEQEQELAKTTPKESSIIVMSPTQDICKQLEKKKLDNLSKPRLAQTSSKQDSMSVSLCENILEEMEICETLQLEQEQVEQFEEEHLQQEIQIRNEKDKSIPGLPEEGDQQSSPGTRRAR